MKFTVKALEGVTKDFDLPGELAVKDLKARILKEMDMPIGVQRLIFQGKVMKDDKKLHEFELEGKAIHLVKNAPAEKAPEMPRRVYDMGEVMDISTQQDLPPDLTANLKQVTQENVKAMVGTFSSDGRHALVSTTVHILDNDGQPISSYTHSNSSLVLCALSAEDEAAKNPPSVTEDELARRERAKIRKREKEEAQAARRARLAQFRERIKDQQRKGQEQTNILEVYQHMTSARRALQGAESILDDYLGPPETDVNETTSSGGDAEKPAPPSEATRPSEEASKSESSSSGATALEEPKPKENGDEGKPEYSVGDDGRPRQRILTEQGMLLPAGAHLYAALCEDVAKLMKRAIKLYQKYSTKLYAEESYDRENLEEYFANIRVNEQLVKAVQRFNNAMGQAHNALAKVQVNLDGEPPRIVSLIPGKRSENPLVSLLSAPLSDDDDDDSDTAVGSQASSRPAGSEGAGGSGGGGGNTLAGLLGSLMAARAAMRMMEDEDKEERKAKAAEDSTEKKEEDAKEEKKTGGAESANNDDDDDDDSSGVNPFLPGPVAMLQQMIRHKQERERQEQMQQEREGEQRTVVIEADESFIDTISKIRQAIGGPAAEIMPPTLLGNLTEKCMRRLTIQEVVMIFGGNHEPLKSIHGTLREFIREVVLEGTEPTAELIPKAIDSFLEGLPAVLRGIDPPLPLKAAYDFPLSAQKCCAFVLREAFELIITTPDDDESFAEKIHSWAMKSGTLLTCVFQECLCSPNDLAPNLKRIADMMFPDNNTPGVLSMLNSQSLVDKFCDRAGSTELTKEEIVCHLVTASQEPTAMETDPPNGSAQNAEEQAWPRAMPQEWASTLQADRQQMESVDDGDQVVPAKKRKQLESGEAEPQPSDP